LPELPLSERFAERPSSHTLQHSIDIGEESFLELKDVERRTVIEKEAGIVEWMNHVVKDEEIGGHAAYIELISVPFLG
jgi:hypothetical protein